MIRLKKLFKEEAVPANKRDVKKMEMTANKIVSLMKGLAKDFKRVHGTKENMLRNKQKGWEELARKADIEYGGWFGYVYDSDFVDKK
jgi:arsenate reductase-like glutaredoxin family protein